MFDFLVNDEGAAEHFVLIFHFRKPSILLFVRIMFEMCWSSLDCYWFKYLVMCMNNMKRNPNYRLNKYNVLFGQNKMIINVKM